MLLYERLIDQIKGEGQLQQDIRDATVVLIDNVAKFYYEESEKVDWHPEDFPNIAPPWEKAFYEWTVPTWTNIGGTLHRLEDVHSKEGVLIVSGPSSVMETGWECHCLHFWLNRGSKTPITLAKSMFPITEDGQPVITPMSLSPWDRDSDGNLYLKDEEDEERANLLDEMRSDGELFDEELRKGKGIICWAELAPGAGVSAQAVDMAMLQVRIPWLAISLSHCKNVEVSQVSPPEKLSQKQQRRHGVPKVRYHVLEITPMRQVLRNEGELIKHGDLRKALHICRGHFKDYRERGLFGRNKGIYWWGEHARGSLYQGVVTKDYEIKRES